MRRSSFNRRREYQSLAERDDRGDTTEEADLGIIEGGTWEHRKRAREMLSTVDATADLTDLHHGKHHIAQFLPQHELDTFLKSAEARPRGALVMMKQKLTRSLFPGQATTRGETPAPPPREPALDASNKGFQMLQSAGWCEGTGLGAGGQGVVAPVSVVPANENGQGVGTTETHAVTQDDDEFDQYRKRMMLAYRFRPNPLNSACPTYALSAAAYPQ